MSGAHAVIAIRFSDTGETLSWIVSESEAAEFAQVFTERYSEPETHRTLED